MQEKGAENILRKCAHNNASDRMLSELINRTAMTNLKRGGNQVGLSLCLSVCLSVCLCVCACVHRYMCAKAHQSHSHDQFEARRQPGLSVCLCVRACICVRP